MKLGRMGSSFGGSWEFHVRDGLQAVFVNRFPPVYNEVPLSQGRELQLSRKTCREVSRDNAPSARSISKREEKGYSRGVNAEWAQTLRSEVLVR